MTHEERQVSERFARENAPLSKDWGDGWVHPEQDVEKEVYMGNWVPSAFRSQHPHYTTAREGKQCFASAPGHPPLKKGLGGLCPMFVERSEYERVQAEIKHLLERAKQ